MSTIVSFEIVQSGDDSREVWVIVPMLPVEDWPTVKASLPPEYAGLELVEYRPLSEDGRQPTHDVWITRQHAA